MLPVAILAGGLATRLRPITVDRPKALLDINGEPFLAHQLRLLKRSGVDRVVMCVGHLDDMVREFAGNGKRFGLSIEYSTDGAVLLGTAGAIKKALPLLGERFFVLYGDSYLPCSYQAVEEAFLKSGQPGQMTVFRNNNQWEPSNVEFRDGCVVAYDKRVRTAGMEHIDYGLSAFHSSAFGACGHEPADLASVFQSLIGQGRLSGHEVNERFYEVGSWEGILTLQAHLRRSASLVM
jgi:N-acetyl-alpha-D-muramate 1-phosphate uridylyltransferase